MCCDYHIGRAVKDKLTECNTKCEKVINDGAGKNQSNKTTKASSEKPIEKTNKKDSKRVKPKKVSKKVKAEKKLKDFFKE